MMVEISDCHEIRQKAIHAPHFNNLEKRSRPNVSVPIQ